MGEQGGVCYVDEEGGLGHLALQTRHMRRFLREAREIGPVLVEPLSLYRTPTARRRTTSTTTMMLRG